MTLNLNLKRIGIDTQNESVIYIRSDSLICLSEGFVSQARIRIKKGGKKYIIATLNTVTTPLLRHNEAGLSEYAWKLLDAKDGEEVELSHPKPLHSLSYIRAKIYGGTLNEQEIKSIIEDAVAGHLSDIHISAFVAACSGGRLNEDEILYLTKAMVTTGKYIDWKKGLIVDKHCVGGLPGNRTTPIVVAIVAAYGLTMPKTSSRSITSPAGTADTMEVLAPVELSIEHIRKVVDKENGCIVWGGAVSLSPADDVLIRVERTLDLDSEGQLVASILSKKIAVGSTNVVIDIPVGPTAKVRDIATATRLSHLLKSVGKKLGLMVKVIITEGFEPVGRGIGPALEARDVVQVLQNHKDAPHDLREHALILAANVLEFSDKVGKKNGYAIAEEILKSGKAWEKFQAICAAQGGMREIPTAAHRHDHLAQKTGKIIQIDTRRISLLAKLAGAPQRKAAGVDMHVKLHNIVEKGQPLFTVHAESPGELNYALSYLNDGNEIVKLEEME